MRLIHLPLAVLLVFLLTSFSDPKDKLVITSTAFQNNDRIPIKYTCMGSDFSPPIAISNVPGNTKSFVIIVYDPDGIKIAPASASNASHTKPAKHTGKKRPAKESASILKCNPADNCFINWIIWNIDADNVQIPENFKNDNEGFNSTNEVGYHGICPSSGTHTYHFVVYALDTKLNISKKSTKAQIEKVMLGHILATGELVGIFNKNYK